MSATASDLTIRLARQADIAAIVSLISEDESGLHPDRSDGDMTVYQRAFENVAADARNELFIAERGGTVLGSFQLTYIPYLFDHGSERALIEAMFVASAARGQGIGGAMVGFALDRARNRGCAMAQLDSNRQRADAHRFYEAAGFEATHLGFKTVL